MFQMNPYQSWSTVIVLLLLVACFVWLLIEAQKRNAGRETERRARAARAQMALVPELPADDLHQNVTELHPVGHLATVTPIHRMAEPAPYDWQKQGI